MEAIIKISPNYTTLVTSSEDVKSEWESEVESRELTGEPLYQDLDAIKAYLSALESGDDELISETGLKLNAEARRTEKRMEEWAGETAELTRDFLVAKNFVYIDTETEEVQISQQGDTVTVKREIWCREY